MNRSFTAVKAAEFFLVLRYVDIVPSVKGKIACFFAIRGCKLLYTPSLFEQPIRIWRSTYLCKFLELRTESSLHRGLPMNTSWILSVQGGRAENASKLKFNLLISMTIQKIKNDLIRNRITEVSKLCNWNNLIVNIFSVRLSLWSSVQSSWL
jgi:hypothetical protein